MSTKADTPISVLSLSLSCNPSSCRSPPLPPHNHPLSSLRVVTAYLSLHSRGVGVRANTHAHASVWHLHRGSWVNAMSADVRWMAEHCLPSSHLCWLVSWGMQKKLLYSKDEHNGIKVGWGAGHLQHPRDNTLTTAFKFCFFSYIFILKQTKKEKKNLLKLHSGSLTACTTKGISF